MRLRDSALEAIRAHGEEGYPYEICGVLVAKKGSPDVVETRRIKNTIVDRAHDRYEMDPLEHIRVQRDCDNSGLEIVGYYHTHPDHPARPSVFDAERSWAGMTYVIAAIHQGRLVDINAFVPEKDGGPFRPEPLEVG